MGICCPSLSTFDQPYHYHLLFYLIEDWLFSSFQFYISIHSTPNFFITCSKIFLILGIEIIAFFFSLKKCCFFYYWSSCKIDFVQLQTSSLSERILLNLHTQQTVKLNHMRFAMQASRELGLMPLLKRRILRLHPINLLLPWAAYKNWMNIGPSLRHYVSKVSILAQKWRFTFCV